MRGQRCHRGITVAGLAIVQIGMRVMRGTSFVFFFQPACPRRVKGRVVMLVCRSPGVPALSTFTRVYNVCTVGLNAYMLHEVRDTADGLAGHGEACAPVGGNQEWMDHEHCSLDLGPVSVRDPPQGAGPQCARHSTVTDCTNKSALSAGAPALL